MIRVCDKGGMLAHPVYGVILFFREEGFLGIDSVELWFKHDGPLYFTFVAFQMWKRKLSILQIFVIYSPCFGKPNL